MKIHDKFYINGSWCSPHGQRMTDVINPATAEVCGRVPRGDETDVECAVQAARGAFEDWSQTSAEERSSYIEAIADKLAERIPEIAATITEELGAPVELSSQIQAGAPATVMASYIDKPKLMDKTEHQGHSLIVREPAGVCAFITPWNYPLHQIITKVAPALAAGCTMVVKPAQETPLSAFILAQIMDEVSLPKGVFNLICGAGGIVGEAMCTHSEVDLISFTGSTVAGRRVSELASQGIKHVCLELGGKSANIILKDADLKAAIQYQVRQVMSNSGQSCNALSRMLIPRSRYDEAAILVKETVTDVSVGDPGNSNSFMGPMCSASIQSVVRSYIEQGINEGAELLIGGLGEPEGVNRGFYVLPTVFVNVTNDMVIAREEIFGPVLCMIAYDNTDEAIAIANDSPYGLSGAVWSEDHDRAIAVARRLRTGQVYINGAAFNFEAPFGGYQQSGNGRELGAEGMNEYMEIKAIQLNEPVVHAHQ